MSRIAVAAPLPLAGKWTTLLWLTLVEFLAMSVWFSATAVVPTLTQVWALDGAGQAGLTMAVQAGFVVGAVASALLNLADRIPARQLLATSALLAAGCTLLIPLAARGLAVALPLRFLTGLFLAGVYPVGMKIVSTWTREDRGLGIGLLVAGLTLGNAAPHLLSAIGGATAWRSVLYGAGALGVLGALLALAFVREGPYRTAAPRFHWRYAGEVLRQRDIVLANLGYLGHMWELYAVLTWLPVFLVASFNASGTDATAARLTAFVAVGAGAASCLVAGRLADRLGRTTVTIAALAVSGACATGIGWLFGGDARWIALLSVVWGLAVIPDSAQFSACVSELCQPEYIGTALTIQTSLGFLLTMATIRLVPALEGAAGWGWAFAFLALGPLVGAVSMGLLRRLPEAARLAGGNR